MTVADSELIFALFTILNISAKIGIFLHVLLNFVFIGSCFKKTDPVQIRELWMPLCKCKVI